MDLGFTEGHADAQDGAVAFAVDPQGDEDGAIQELAPMANLFVTGIQDQVGKGPPGGRNARLGALAGFGSLIRLGLEGLRSLLAHRLVDQQADALGKAGGALLGQELQHRVQEFRMGLVGRHGFALEVFADTPTGNHDAPPFLTSFSRARSASRPFRGRSDGERSEASAASRKGWRAGKKKRHSQKEIYTPRFTPDTTYSVYRSDMSRDESR